MAKYAKKLVLQWELDKRRDISDLDITDSDEAAAYFRKMIGYPPNEHFAFIAMNAQLDYIGEMIVNQGTATTALVDAPMLLRAALLSGAQAIVLCHNHPNCTPEPSIPDRKMTFSLLMVCNLIGIAVVDHLILGDDGSYHSMRANQDAVFTPLRLSPA